MTSPEFDTSELHQYAAQLKTAPVEVLAKVRGSLTRHANQVAKVARQNAPRDRPWLATEGITVTASAGRLSRRIATGSDPRGKPVGLMVEFGTSKMPPRPFMRPALNQVGPAFAEDLGHILTQGIP